MRKLSVFNNVTLDGFFADLKGDMSWAHKQDAEWNAFAADNAKGESQLVFGRVTYDLMAGWWPTAAAIASFPTLASRMNSLSKVVFSRTLAKASWNNTRVVKGSMAEEMRKLKAEPGPDLVVMGSGTIVSQCTQACLIDEYQIVVNPIILGAGKSMFDGVNKTLALRQTKARTFGNGNVFLCYEPVKD